MTDNNLLLALHTYATQQDENFTTEAFVHVLRHLQIHEPKIACAFFDFLTDKQIRFEATECSELEIRTQWSFSGGTPDILIKGPDHFVIVEVKVEAQPGITQLDRYREELEKQDEHQTCLTLLSRYPVDPNEKVKADACVRWHGIGRLLDQSVRKISEPVSAMLVLQFLEFLKERGMAMEKVGWELTRGVQALLSLMSILDEAMDSSKDITKRERLGGTSTNGFGFLIGGTKCWAGVYLSRPQVLVFEAYNLTKEAAQKAGFGRLVGKESAKAFGRFEKQNKGASKWVNELDLESENVHFFALSPDNQQIRLEEFVNTGVSEIKKMA